MRFCLLMLLFSAITVAARPQSAPDFSRLSKQDNDRCLPKRSGDATLCIEHHDPELTIETSVSHDSVNLRRAIQKYTTDGRASVSTGVDGDEFVTAVAWKDSSLVFSIEEHEGAAFFARPRYGRSSRTAPHFSGPGRALMAGSRFFFISGNSARPGEFAHRPVRAVELGWQ